MSTPADTLQRDSQPIPAIKPRKWRIPSSVRTSVIIGRANGKPISHIAKELGISHNSTKLIIEDSNIEKQLALGTVSCAMLIPKATQAIEKSLDRGDGSLGIRLLEGLGVLGEGRSGTHKPQQIELSAAIGIMFKQEPKNQADAAITVTAEQSPASTTPTDKIVSHCTDNVQS